ncbi:conjugation system SOS inhibitor PsiB family protein [Pantoea sp. A4]|uniref:conjugation system SOS inhibitor PsiB family protein n=1 Tax=Pantoea sp. A4 TaxID=1225184 RepID=UPI0003748353|nr:conjugation system SOS inhibitor PsiB family protein [Pantoea sp. A4]
MSAAQSKAKNVRGKRVAPAAHLNDVPRLRVEDMTPDAPLGVAELKQFSAADFEAWCLRGEDFRRRLSAAVIAALRPAHVWRVDFEQGGEWGGVCPVHLRFTHKACDQIIIDVMSAGPASPYWNGLLWVNTGSTGLYCWNEDGFDPGSITGLLERIDALVSAGRTQPVDIASVLWRGGPHA